MPIAGYRKQGLPAFEHQKISNTKYIIKEDLVHYRNTSFMNFNLIGSPKL
jgi:hypothetical protein